MSVLVPFTQRMFVDKATLLSLDCNQHCHRIGVPVGLYGIFLPIDLFGNQSALTYGKIIESYTYQDSFDISYFT